MKKVLLLILSMLTINTLTAQVKLTAEELRFVSNVIRYEKEELQKVEMTKDSHIVLFFPTTKYVLNPKGFVHEVFIKEDNSWVSLGTETDGH